MENYLLISDAAKRVQVESHVLRYWEEELKLPIKRNEAGHRYYTDNDIERFLQIKSMKERGLQLKAIKMILKDGKLDVLPVQESVQPLVVEADADMREVHAIKSLGEAEIRPNMAIDIVKKEETISTEETKEERAQRLQWLLKQLIKETLQENNKELCRDIKEGVVKELDYQFRCQEERENERYMEQEKRNDEYYKRMDELLRKKSGRIRREKAEKGRLDQEKSEKEKIERVEKEKPIKQKFLKGESLKEKPVNEKTQQKENTAQVLPLKKKRHLFS